MKTVRTIPELRDELAHSRRPIGLVPTMGYFHEGHLALMRAARADNRTVVVSLFVNPTQFRPGEDLDTYPRDEGRDARLAAAEGVDFLFAPSVDEVYPAGFDATVSVGGLTEPLDGAARPGHFRGVCTVVAKLFALSRADVAVFGEKDFQQLMVVRRMAVDLSQEVVEADINPLVLRPKGAVALDALVVCR